MKSLRLIALATTLLFFTACEPEKKADSAATATDSTGITPTNPTSADAKKADAKTAKTSDATKSDKTSTKKAAEKSTAKPPTVPAKLTDPDPNELIAAEYEPQPKNLDAVNKMIQYPADAKNASVSGTVYLKILVDETGAYKKHVVRRSPDERLTKAVEAHIKKLRYTPARNGGQSIRFWVNYEYEFKP